MTYEKNRSCRSSKTQLSALAIAASLATSAAWAETTWDLPVQWPDGNFMTEIVNDFAATIEERTDGELILRVQSGGSLGIEGAEMIGAIRDGLFPIGEYSLAQAVGVVPIFGLERLPGLFENTGAFAIFTSVSRPAYQKALSEHDQIILFNVPWPPSHIHLSEGVSSLGELDGRRIRTYDPFGTEFYSQLGASPIQMPWGEVIPALASGVLEGVHTSASSAVDGQFWEFLTTTELVSAQTSTSALVVSTSALQQLSEAHRQILLDTAREMEVQYWLRSQENEARSIAILEENGMTVEAAPQDVRDAAFEAAQTIAQTFAEDVPEAAALLDKYYALRGATDTQ